MAQSRREWLETVFGGLLLLLLLQPAKKGQRGAGACYALLALVLLVGVVRDFLLADPPRAFEIDGLQNVALDAVLMLVGGFLAAQLLGRPHLAFSISCWAAGALLLWLPLLVELMLATLPEDAWPIRHLLEIQVVYWLAVTLRVLQWLAGPLRFRLLAISVAQVALALTPWLLGSTQLRWFHQIEDEPGPEREISLPPLVAERTLYEQSRLLERALSALEAERPGVVDLYWIAFAGDGTERVFRNEAEYFERLMAQRFDARGRGVVLVNSPYSIAERPLATRTALARTLRTMARRMDANEDLLLLFLTLHGTEDHQLVVRMPPLPLEPIRPEDLARLLRTPGLGTQLVIVSACYSGGFLPALSDPRRIVITASRADRASFGCGAESEVTYFGRAFLVDAWNRHADPRQAFEEARRLVHSRESTAGFTASEPQIDIGAEAESKLSAWLAERRESEVIVPFFPAPTTR